MQSELPFYEDIETALTSAVTALGGSKKVGGALWPHKTGDAASKTLLDGINPGRKEKLEISEVMWIFSRARDEGFHSPFLWFAAQIGYDAKPISKTDEVNRLANVIESASKTIASAAETLERIQRGNTLKVAS